MIRSTRTKSQGFTLLELLLVLGVIAALAIAAFIVYPSVQASNQANTESANINTIRAGVQNLFGSLGRYDTLTTGVANEARIFPPTMNAGLFGPTAPITNIWSGAVTLAPAQGNGGPGGTADTHFTITYEDITDAACVKLAPAVAPNFDAVQLNGITIADPQGLLGAVTAFNPALVGANCTSATNQLILTAR